MSPITYRPFHAAHSYRARKIKKAAFLGEGSFFMLMILFLELFVDAHVAGFFIVEYLVDVEEDSGFLDVAEFGVDGRSEHPHCGRQGHVGVYQRWYLAAVFADEVVQDPVVFLVVGAGVSRLYPV